jgi:hypothetical protein
VMVKPAASSSLRWIAWDFISCRDSSAFSHTSRDMRRIAGSASVTALAATVAEDGGTVAVEAAALVSA